jgi:hypothetical protein
MRTRDGEEATLYLLIAAIGSIPVVLVLWRGGVFDRDSTIGLAMLLLAIAGLLAMWHGARKERRGKPRNGAHRRARRPISSRALRGLGSSSTRRSPAGRG